ncbi:SHOCT domain-containing protein [Enterococcus xiangfangensis]|uniref:SHOCT domain-containing protein n=1 Tax=Enterococcus xiangfangensis TaxID=1296537 RepID=UPI003D1687B1
MGFMDKMKQSISDVSNTSNTEFDIQYSTSVSFIAGDQLVGANGLFLKQMIQLSDGRIIFNKKEPIYFDLLSIDFDGAKFHEEVISNATGDSRTLSEENSKTKKKRHSLGGAVVGTILMPGVGTAIGALAGSKSGKDKTKKNGNSHTNINESSIVKTQQVEDDSSTTISLKNISTEQIIQIVLKTKTADYQKLTSFQISQDTVVEPVQVPETEKSAIEQVKELKELLDMDIITQEEFDLKKKELLNL